MGTCFRIKELRQSAGLTQAQLAFRLDLKSPSTVTFSYLLDSHFDHLAYTIYHKM